MKELYVFCEGPTEQGFCDQVLSPSLFPNHDGFIRTIKVAHNKSRGVVRRGGIGKYEALKRDVLNQLKARELSKGQPIYFTTMIDVYGP